MKKMLTLMMVSAFTLIIVGCHTVHGAGKDVESAGQSMQDAAD